MDASQMQRQKSQSISQRHLYSGKLLAALAVTSGVSTLLIISDYVFRSNLGAAYSPLVIVCMILYLLVIVTILIADWHGFLTMNGFLQWKSMTGKQRLIVGCLFAALNVIVLGIYLTQVYLKYHQYMLEEESRARLKIAEQEAGLGMMPQTDGECHNCHRPLQLGAEFCAYCGERVAERPRICPACYSLTLPDARWCPECGAQLDISVLSL